MRVMMSKRDLVQMERDRAIMDRDQAIAQRQETEQRFIEIRALCTRPTVAFARELVRVGEREDYY